MSELRRLPYGANFLSLDTMPELKAAIEQRVLFRYLTEGESVATRLERQAAEQFSVRHCLAVHNCTEALRLALVATQPKIGDLVYIPSVAFVAVAGAVLSCGLIPVLVDVDEDFSLDVNALPDGAQRVIVAHMEGTVGKIPSGVPFVIEDAAQSLGARHPDGRLAGSAGYAGVFSFHHNKILTSGEGGLLITNDDSRYLLMQKYHDHGSTRIHGEYPRWDIDAFYGENFVTSECIAAIQFQQFHYLSSIITGLERGYNHLRFLLGSQYRILERKTGDLKLSVRIEFDTVDQASRARDLLFGAGLPVWTLARYFLPDHPILSNRRSIYSDGFPWNLVSTPLPALSRLAETRERLSRILCLPISPELSSEEQLKEAEVVVETLYHIK